MEKELSRTLNLNIDQSNYLAINIFNFLNKQKILPKLKSINYHSEDDERQDYEILHIDAEIPNLFRSLNLPDDALSILKGAISDIETYIDKKGMADKKTTQISLTQANNFEEDITQIKLSIKIDRDIKYIYRIIRPEVYKIISKTLSYNILKNLIVSFDCL